MQELHTEGSCTKTAWTKLYPKDIRKNEASKAMLHYKSPIDHIKSNNICSFLKISVSINGNPMSNILLFKSLIGILNHFNKQISISFLAFVDKIVSNNIFKKLKGKSCTIEAKERWSTCNLSNEEICIK